MHSETTSSGLTQKYNVPLFSDAGNVCITVFLLVLQYFSLLFGKSAFGSQILNFLCLKEGICETKMLFKYQKTTVIDYFVVKILSALSVSRFAMSFSSPFSKWQAV